ncbi:hypothetical protein O9H85_15430 [Paenibacillus filicis]|uniref:Uncharacterized protein n=1 Tax=Paenibacillus gyeongsangnamensis TaxID=3388067 RepID=A0ABT4QAC8_9BACL|nr:hypothetical protein [Paenibacillus filicis]MCZ8513800.1 hypothetical protein [Paenibacillus filicis]
MAEFWKRIFRLREKTAAELLAEKYFDEIGNNSPYRLAQHLDVGYSYTKLGNLVGLYTSDPLNPDHQHIYINLDIDHEEQAEVVSELMYHHLEQKGIERSLTKREVDKAARQRRKGTLWWI